MGTIVSSQGSAIAVFDKYDTGANTYLYVESRIETDSVNGVLLEASTGGTSVSIPLRLRGGGTAGHVNVLNSLTPTVGTLSDSAGGTIAINSALANLFEITLGTTAGNRTLGTPTNSVDGLSMTLRIKQNSNNTGTAVWPTGAYIFNENGTPTLGTTSSWNYYSWRYHSGDAKWHFQGVSNGIV